MSATSDIAPSVSSRWPRFLVIAIVVAATLGLRALNLNDPLWLDEMHTSWVVMDSFSDVAPRAAIGNQTPLYFWLNWLVVQVHESEISLRLVSYFAAGTLAGLIADTLWRWCEAAEVPPMGPALCAGLLFAIDPIFIFYGTEARPYALLQLVAFWRLRRLSLIGDAPTAWQRVGMIASGAALVWLHLTGGLIFAGELAALLVWQGQGRGCYPVRRWLVDLAAIAAACVPLAWLAMFVFGRRQNFEGMVGSPTWDKAWTILHGNELAGTLLLGGAIALFVDTLLVAPAESKEPRERFAGLSQLPKRLVKLVTGPFVWAGGAMAIALVAHAMGIAPFFWLRYLTVAGLLLPLIVATICGFRSSFLGTALAFVLCGLTMQWTGLNGRLVNVDDIGFRAIDDRRRDWNDRFEPRELNYFLTEDEVEILGRTTPILVDAGLIESDVSWRSEMAIERDYSTFPVRAVNRLGISRIADAWGLPRGWRERNDVSDIPPEAVEKYRDSRALIVMVVRAKDSWDDANKIASRLTKATGRATQILHSAVDEDGKYALFWLGPRPRDYKSEF